ncbi:hypothetical protein BaRGS_00010890 [Batillaria attramentaria]|uniref:Uncharacterized protein n=1 Tax=Batillaria attramentaria TaxID=370345 RepID=A0ABD0LE51_9CAEN
MTIITRCACTGDRAQLFIREARTMGPRWILLFLLSMLCHVTLGDYDRSVCDPDAFRRQYASNPGPNKPLLALNYALRVEANLMELNRTVDAHEYYDYTNNRGAVHQWDRGVHTHVIFNYNTKQLITVTTPDRANPLQHDTRCEVQDLSTYNSSYMFGARKFSNGSEHIYNIGDTLRMAVSNPDIYLGVVETEGGAVAQAWRSCIYMPNMAATFNATWYFTAKGIWVSTIGDQVPLSLHIQGRTAGANPHDFEHQYVFADFRPNFADIDDTTSLFETSQGVYCPNRVNTMPLPNVTNNFSFKMEVVDTATQLIDTIEEYYDYDIRVMRYEFQSLIGSVYGPNPVRRVHDFNTGVAYVIDKVLGNCTVTPISNLGFDAQSTSAANVRMRTKEEFFDLNTKYTYTGTRTVRDIECDVWLGVKDDWPSANSFETHWEWYFTTRSWMESVGYQFEVRLPVQLRMSAQDFDPPFERIFSIYDYKEGQNNPWDFGISPCFTTQHRKEYTLTMPGNYSKLVGQDKNSFIYFFVLSITANAKVSFMRVANVQLDYDDVNIYGSFSLLDQAPITGDVTMQEPERSLQQAAANLEFAVTSGTFIVNLQLQYNSPLTRLQATKFTVGVPPTLRPAPPSHRRRRENIRTRDNDLLLDVQAGAPAPSSSVSYDSGAMAGLGVAMVIVGYGLGFVVMLFLYRRFFAPPRLEIDNPLTVMRSSREEY